MSDMNGGLSDAERAELEQLRAEKAARAQAQAAAAERAELEALRREQARADEESAQLAREERARRMMEPDDDLKMPAAQKALIVGAVVVLIIAIVYIWVAPK